MASLDSASLLKRIVFGALIGAGIFFGSFYLARATSTFIVQQGGTGSTTLGGILKGNGTSPIGSVVIGSGLSYDGTTLSSTGGSGTVTQINTTWPILGGPITTTGTLTFGGLSTSSPGITSGQPIYATGVNTIASVASSTFLTSIGGQAAGNYITALTGDVTASGPGSAAATLATVNSNVGSFTNANITVNAKGLITAASNGSAGSSGLATSSPISSSNLLVYSTSGAGSAYGVATSTLTATSPLTGSFTQIGSGGSLGCQTASGSQAGCLSSADWTTFNGKLSSAITAVGPTGQTQTGATQILATSTSAFDGLTPNLTITASGDTQTFTSSLSGTLSVAGGGTGRTSNPSGNYLLGNSTGAIANKSPAGVLADITSGNVILNGNEVDMYSFAATSTTATSSLAHASATQFAVGSITGIITAVSGYLQQLALSAAFVLSGGTLHSVVEKSFTYATTTWTGTTTHAIEQSILAKTVIGMRCKTYTALGLPGGTVNVAVGNYSATTTLINASSTNNFITQNVSASAGDSWYFTAGTPASAPVELNCTVEYQI